MTDSTSGAVGHRVLIVEDEPLYRAGLRAFLERQMDLTCCGEADTCEGALTAAGRCNPELIILNLRLRQGDGLQLIQNLLARQPALRILVLSHTEEDVYATLALRAGAMGYVRKTESTEELLTAIRVVLRGDLYLSRRLGGLLLKRLLQRPAGGGISDKLSDRELQVFQCLGRGLGRREIAAQLYVSVKTVASHREHIMRKLELPNTPSLLQAAQAWVQASGE